MKIMNKTVVVTYYTESDLAGTDESRAERQVQIKKMIDEGKTYGIVTRVSPTAVALSFEDQSAAEEWVNWCYTQFSKYNKTPVSIEIQ